jgi:hypothetical protein
MSCRNLAKNNIKNGYKPQHLFFKNDKATVTAATVYSFVEVPETAKKMKIEKIKNEVIVSEEPHDLPTVKIGEVVKKLKAKAVGEKETLDGIVLELITDPFFRNRTLVCEAADGTHKCHLHFGRAKEDDKFFRGDIIYLKNVTVSFGK